MPRSTEELNRQIDEQIARASERETGNTNEFLYVILVSIVVAVAEIILLSK